MKSFHRHWQGSTSAKDIFYEVGGQRTFSKIQALIWANGDPARVTYHCLTGIWDQWDWTREPIESMQSMVDRRCRQIRDSHDYVALWFSGGYDSQTILDGFLRQNLVIDELLIWKREYFTDWSSTAECADALAQAQQLKNTVYPNLKIREVFYTADVLKDFYRDFRSDWILQPVFQPTLTKGARPFLYNHNPGFQRTLDQTNRTDIEGREKPRLLIEDGWWCATSFDVTSEWQMDSPSTQFYTTGDMPEMEIKQAWCMVNWLESLPLTTEAQLSRFLHDVQGHKTDAKVYEAWNRALGRSAVKSLASYTTSVNGSKKWFCGDVTNTWESQEIKLFFQSRYPDVWSTYINGIQQIKELAPGIFDEQNQIRPIIGKRYRIKPVEPGRLLSSLQPELKKSPADVLTV